MSGRKGGHPFEAPRPGEPRTVWSAPSGRGVLPHPILAAPIQHRVLALQISRCSSALYRLYSPGTPHHHGVNTGPIWCLSWLQRVSFRIWGGVKHETQVNGMSATEELYPFPDPNLVFVPMEFWPEFLASTTGTEFLAGGMGGMAGVMAGHPLDTVRIRLQQPRLVASATPTTATGLIKHIVSTEGTMALFKGMATPLATIAFQNAVAFQAYALFSRALSDRASQEPLSYQKVAIAGIAAGTIQTAILTPVDLIKIRLQIATERRAKKSSLQSPQAGPLGLVRNIVRREGIKGLYRGWTATVIRDAPSHAVYFGTYEYMRELLHPGCRTDGEEPLSTMLVSGGLAGSLSWLCCYPLDVVKSRLQAQGAGGAPPQYKGIMDCIRTSARQEGKQVFWRGLGPSLARAFLVNGAIFSAYELSLRYLSPRSPKGDLDFQPIL